MANRDEIANGVYDVAQQIADSPFMLTRVISAYRELHTLFGRKSIGIPDGAIMAEKLLVDSLSRAGSKCRYLDNLALAAGTWDGGVRATGEEAQKTGSLHEAAIMAVKEAYSFAPDCLMIEPGVVGAACEISGEVSSLNPRIVGGDAIGLVPGGVEAVKRQLPNGLKITSRLGQGSTISAEAPLYDLMMVKSGRLVQDGVGSWGVRGETIPAVKIRYLDGKAGTEAGAGAKCLGLKRREKNVFMTIPFSPLEGIHTVGAKEDDALRLIVERKLSGEEADPLGKIPYAVDGDFPLHRLITGVVLEPNTPDKSKSLDPETGEIASDADIYDEEHVRLSMYWWMANTRGRLTYLHTLDGGEEVTEEVPLLACWQQYPERQWGTKLVKAGTWLITAWAKPDGLWKLIEEGRIRGLSIGYVALGRIET